MFTIAADGHATEQFSLLVGTDRRLDANREGLEIPDIVDFHGMARPNDADDHSRYP
jgi:hypothetical protein